MHRLISLLKQSDFYLQLIDDPRQHKNPTLANFFDLRYFIINNAQCVAAKTLQRIEQTYVDLVLLL